MKQFVLIAFLALSFSINAQDFKIEEKTITGTFENPNKSKSELFALINKWISINYNSSKNVIQMNDSESGTIIIKGINDVTFKNPGKALNPKIATDNSTMSFNHLIEINIKENKYRVIYKLVSLSTEDYGYNQMTFDCINLAGNSDVEIQKFLDSMDIMLKKGMIGKEKRERYMTDSKLSFDEIKTNLIYDMKTTMLSIGKSISSSEKDGW